jgi:hypothetical protein
LLVVVFHFLRFCLSFALRRLASVVLVFLRFLLCLLFVMLHGRLLPCLSCGRLLCLFYPLIRDNIRVSTSSLVVRIVALLVTAPTATGMDTLCPTVIGGILVCVASTRLARLLVHQAPLQLPSVIRTLSVVFVVCSPLQVLLRQALLVL